MGYNLANFFKPLIVTALSIPFMGYGILRYNWGELKELLSIPFMGYISNCLTKNNIAIIFQFPLWDT